MLFFSGFKCSALNTTTPIQYSHTNNLMCTAGKAAHTDIYFDRVNYLHQGGYVLVCLSVFLSLSMLVIAGWFGGGGGGVGITPQYKNKDEIVTWKPSMHRNDQALK